MNLNSAMASARPRQAGQSTMAVSVFSNSWMLHCRCRMCRQRRRTTRSPCTNSSRQMAHMRSSPSNSTACSAGG